MYARVVTLVLIFAYIESIQSFDSRNIVFTIVSQPEPYHASVAKRLKQDIENQVLQLEKRYPKTHITHEDFPVSGAWTILPLLAPLTSQYRRSDVRWVLFVETHTAVRCDKLIQALAAADKQKDVMWIGYPLSDEEPTIIHHFTFYEDLEEEGGFVYPNFASGFAMRIELIEILLKQIENGQRRLEADFSIDPAFELAQLVYGGGTDPGPLLTPDLSFCIVSGDNCATYPRQFDICGSPIPEDSIYFAVKTWTGFHNTRARVVKKTWGRHVTHLVFYSDTDDPSLPAVSTGVANSKTGHCAKTMTILRMVLRRVNNMPHIKWIFLADDDTILGVQRLCEVLSCYRGGADVTVLGERYGYGYGKKETAAKGYDYITGGGGTALSVGGARALAACSCGAALSARAAPDDMTLGACAHHRLNISMTHSPLFHQARPQDYAREVLTRDRPVSFHRHSSPEPTRVYATWFQHDDLAVRKTRRRDEL
ncbi:beta-1,3-glucosyltransferase isoform X2 [Spodoptera frugiperda]|uniref:Beta-1,3-glucosyltransferase isoform X2 n=1 Tax=Spodoptera frugiperda TaxID=7108 RepID=A0A9R0D1P7_SPOFR|nr:beta-1,3-glucosyltransferase isoform X2 [Spodoptera frugiperda]